MTDAVSTEAPGFWRNLGEQMPLIRTLATTRRDEATAAAAIYLLLMQWGYYVFTILRSQDLILPQGPVIGGDFVVFWQAAQTALAEKPLIYEFAEFNRRLGLSFPAHEGFGLGWQYPPTMFALLSPLTGAPYLAAYFAWVGALGGAFLAFCHRLWATRRTLLFVAASPAAFQATITGQTGFLTASLFAAAAYYAKSRPILAGVAAGLLTVKPQLGLLIPIAFAAAGCWRAFAAAAATSLALLAFAYGLYGSAPFIAFFEAIGAHSDRLDAAGFPVYKLTSVYGFFMCLKAPAGLAMAAQAMASLAIAVFVFLVWRRTDDLLARVGVLTIGALLTSPYAFYYEMPLVIPALVLLARRGAETGFLFGERPMLAALYVAPLAMPGPHPPTISFVFVGVAAAFFLVARRGARAARLTFANASAPAAAGS